jgi:hypothetical protein
MNYRIVEQIGSEWRITETDDIAKWANKRGLSWRTNFNPRHQNCRANQYSMATPARHGMVKQSDTRIRRRIMF